MTKLAILGAGGHGRVVADIAESSGWSEIFFFDDCWPEISMSGLWPVVGNQNDLFNKLSEFQGVVVAIGDNALRAEKIELLGCRGAELVNIIAPSAVISSGTNILLGTVIMPQVSVGYGAMIGSGSILNTASTIDHDSILGNSVHVGPGAHLAGEVIVGDGGWVGIGAVISNQVTIGKNAIVGAGSVVISDVEAHSTVVGVPARKLK